MPKVTQVVSSQMGIQAQAFLFFFFNLFYLKANYFTTLKWFLPYTDMNQPWVYTCSPSWSPLPRHSPSHPSGPSECTSPEHPVSCIEPGLEICFTYDNIHISMLSCQIIPPSPLPPSPKEQSKNVLFYAIKIERTVHRKSIVYLLLHTIH